MGGGWVWWFEVGFEFVDWFYCVDFLSGCFAGVGLFLGWGFWGVGVWWFCVECFGFVIWFLFVDLFWLGIGFCWGWMFWCWVGF